jgi:hypothetical protein
MRTLLLAAMVMGCSKDPLVEDMKMFCRAADVESAKDIMHIVPYVMQRVKTDELKQLMATLRDEWASADLFLEDGDKLAKKAGIDDCQTVKVLRNWLEKRRLGM